MSTLGKLQLGRLGAGRKRSGGGSGGAPPLDGLSPTGAWSASRKLLTAYEGSFYTLTSSAVSAWLDQSGNSRNFVQGTATSRPTIANNFADALLFDGVDDGMATTAMIADFISLSAGYIIISIRPTAFPSDSGTFYLNSPVIQDNGQNVGITVRANGGTPLVYGGNYPNSVQNTIAANSTFVIEWRHEGGTLYQRVNGANEQSTASGDTANFPAVVNLGARTAVYQGYVYEIATFIDVPNSTERTALVQSFAAQAGAV